MRLYLRLHKLFRGLPYLLLLIAELFRDEYFVTGDFRHQEFAAFQNSVRHHVTSLEI